MFDTSLQLFIVHGTKHGQLHTWCIETATPDMIRNRTELVEISNLGPSNLNRSV